MKIIVIAGTVVAAVLIVAALFFTFGFGGGLSGKYYLTYYGEVDYESYIEFSGRNKINVYEDGHIAVQGTYKLTGSGTAIEITLYDPSGSGNSAIMGGSVNADKREISIEDAKFVKR
jgi:hypothetical protein